MCVCVCACARVCKCVCVRAAVCRALSGSVSKRHSGEELGSREPEKRRRASKASELGGTPMLPQPRTETASPLFSTGAPTTESVPTVFRWDHGGNQVTPSAAPFPPLLAPPSLFSVTVGRAGARRWRARGQFSSARPSVSSLLPQPLWRPWLPRPLPQVFITGSFNNWSSKVPMHRSGNDFSYITSLPKVSVSDVSLCCLRVRVLVRWACVYTRERE